MKHEYNPDCPDCRPALLDENGNVLPLEHPTMQVVMAVWQASSLDDRAAYIRVTVHNSRVADDVRRANALVSQFASASKTDGHA